MDRLSNELIDLILQQVNRYDLPECALINRQFHTLANPILWWQLDIRDERTFDLLQQTLTLDADHGQYIQEAWFGFIGMNDAHLATFIRQTPNLVHLEMIEAYEVTDTGMAQLVQCPRLDSLRLSNSYITSLNVLRELPQLRELYLYRCLRLCLSFLPKSLTKLELCWSHRSQNDVDTTLAGVAQLDQLTSLILVDDYDFGACMTMTWPQLTCLHLYKCPRLTDATAIAFFRRHPLLVDLGLVNGLFTDAILDAMATYLPGIVYLGICENTNITHFGLRRLIQRCTNLDALDLAEHNLSAADFPGLRAIDEATGTTWQLERDDITTIRLHPIN